MEISTRQQVTKYTTAEANLNCTFILTLEFFDYKWMWFLYAHSQSNKKNQKIEIGNKSFAVSHQHSHDSLCYLLLFIPPVHIVISRFSCIIEQLLKKL